jgi:fluoroacetyl-CoA thioesterase
LLTPKLQHSMLFPFQLGSVKTFTKAVEQNDTATFDAGNVHPVYATFALGRDAEWACRLFVLEMKEDDEEGIGTFLKIEHASPALMGSTVVFEATLQSAVGNSVICSFTAKVGDRLVAFGETGQKILRKEKLNAIFGAL